MYRERYYISFNFVCTQCTVNINVEINFKKALDNNFSDVRKGLTDIVNI